MRILHANENHFQQVMRMIPIKVIFTYHYDFIDKIEKNMLFRNLINTDRQNVLGSFFTRVYGFEMAQIVIKCKRREGITN